jgi:hypothetical protein
MGDGLSLIRLITVSRVRWQHLDTAGPDGHFANRLQISRRIVDAEPLDIGVRGFVINTKSRHRFHRFGRVHDFHGSVTFG